MKARILYLFLLFGVLLFVSCEKEETVEDSVDGTAQETLIIYTYDSFASDWGPAGVVIPAFEEKTGINVEIMAYGDSGQVLSRAIMEKDQPSADIIIGIDNNMLARALDADILEAYEPSYAKDLPSSLIFDPTFHVTPYDYGFFAINYNASMLENPPLNLEDMTKPEYKDSIILMDPRTSSPGLGFLLWTISVYGEDFTDYWKRLMPSVLTIADGWDSGYGLYTNGEAPMVLSYTTSPAYHIEYQEEGEDFPPYRALNFEEGNYMQIEGAGILKDAPHPAAAEAFIEFLYSDEFQSPLTTTNWMFPVNPETSLPASFDSAPLPENFLLLDHDLITENYEKWLEEWVAAVVE